MFLGEDPPEGFGRVEVSEDVVEDFGVVDDALCALGGGAVEVDVVDEVVHLAAQDGVQLLQSGLVLPLDLLVQFLVVVHLEPLTDAPQHIK